jgi:DNA invertase Pin-like site-specific DNA recombinase
MVATSALGSASSVLAAAPVGGTFLRLLRTAKKLRLLPTVRLLRLLRAALLAEFERELIRARTGEGRVRAKACDVRMGRPPKLTPHQAKEALRRRDAGEASREIARSYNVHHSTIARLVP